MKRLDLQMQAPPFSHLPKKSGVYFFKKGQEILYIGKATSLYDRVKSYFTTFDSRPNVISMLTHVTAVDFIETKTPHEALLLEAQLIQTHQPPYNILIKEGHPFLYVCVVKKDGLSQLVLVREKKGRGICVGPFLCKQSTRTVFQFLRREFKLMICGKKIANGCLSYHIDQCAGSCRADFDKEAYTVRLHLAISLLQDDKKNFLSIIDDQLKILIQKQEFERARNFLYYKENVARFFSEVESQAVFKRSVSEVVFVTTKSDIESKYSIDYDTIAKSLQEIAGTRAPVISIDCFDISHMQGTYIVGSAIRFTRGVAEKSAFRRFKIKTLVDQNDYAALGEIVSRRYKDGNYPDLILIDGGKGQRNVIKALQLPVSIISLAKREERLFTDIYPEGLLLDLHNNRDCMLISLRDYAHHFAITYHQTLKNRLK